MELNKNNWETFNGKKVSFDTIDHQHLSNCYWFSKTAYDMDATNLHLIKISNFLADRFNGQLLPYRPHINFWFEINLLRSKDMLRYDNTNVNRIIIYDGISEIGEILCTPDKKITI